jgi:hypothetical protein
MPWTVLFHAEFEPEFAELSRTVRIDLISRLRLVEEFGPEIGRPTVDTLKGSAYPNMKELRFRSEGGVWRIAFAFDPRRRAVVLCGGSKAGGNERRFYKRLIERADRRYARYLSRLE